MELLHRRAGVCSILWELPNRLHRFLKKYTLLLFKLIAQIDTPKGDVWDFQLLHIPVNVVLFLVAGISPMRREDDPLQGFLPLGSCSWGPSSCLLTCTSLLFALFCFLSYPVTPGEVSRAKKGVLKSLCPQPLFSKNGTRMAHPVLPLWSLLACQRLEVRGWGSEVRSFSRTPAAFLKQELFRVFKGPMWLVAHWVSFFLS